MKNKGSGKKGNNEKIRLLSNPVCIFRGERYSRLMCEIISFAHFNLRIFAPSDFGYLSFIVSKWAPNGALVPSDMRAYARLQKVVNTCSTDL